MWILRRVENYEAPDGPKFEGQYADNLPAFSEEVKIVTWNIKYAGKIGVAIIELSQVQPLREADIILLQEMDERGVEAIARALRYNYVYYPASMLRWWAVDKLFGNAVLSKWPILDSRKLLLPHANPFNGQRRIAVETFIETRDRRVVVYCVHTETPMLWPQRKRAQIETLTRHVQRAQAQSGHIVVGGDFNTFTRRGINELEEAFRRIGFVRASDGKHPTVRPKALRLTLDHIFVRGFSVLERGVWAKTKASDHFPNWVKLRFQIHPAARPNEPWPL